MRILVTGHDGYIGKVLMPMLHEYRHDIVGIDMHFYRDRTDSASVDRYRMIECDIRDVEPHHLTGYDAVINLAALSNDPVGNINAKVTDEINHIGAARLARVARDAGVSRFIQMSTCSVYGEAASTLVDESTPLNPVTPYASAKAAAERTIARLANDNFSPVFLRCATAYGPSPHFRGDIVVNNFIGWALVTGEIRIMSDGTAWRPIIHVKDIASAVIAVLHASRDEIHNRSFNIGRNDDNYRVSDIAECVASSLTGTTIRYTSESGRDRRSYRVDFSLFQQTFPEYTPRRSLVDSIPLITEYIKTDCEVHSGFFTSRYLRLERIQELLAAGHLDNELRWITRTAS
ncbi:MAG: SDR family oxidoreductase [Gammaproteobacteria bacterium]|nr:SDR family oxidoreductase [Gammaproteobacteria bacterium]